ncbi:maestro heat-like repeat-containing protein family member 1 [Limulus polyphemus]|uniref:Maestro heat-like repeat-containing protein family member 1 n=1 Tax=Limulus polyphemus TaxID=6850 RepID=A0ABM1BAA5_LIMPO|nr:maestro heat-like repeat-containing protein family member 1 [Limulus polyphemus]XP_013777981.1 maestro heat-like repeat-containing protein family member 1 [Limulus polyphemus]XP_013777982.1 maestro heat-like repeat-containing protein family member 1 [Limulus polyphemus]XP_022245589.1 maestro heat-like repeat-containing protein family member 1 [Limulus polyphemus]
MLPSSAEDKVRTTGGQVDSIVLALIDAAFDKQAHVSQAMCTSLYTIGNHQPDLVLSSCLSYLQQHTKLPLNHRVITLNVMERVCRDSLHRVNEDLASDIIRQAVKEMVNTKEVVPEWQAAASGILVSLGCRFHNKVMDMLLVEFQPAILPHFFVVQTMANLATSNAFGIVPFLKAILGIMLPMLGMIKHENMKWVFSYALARFSEAILEYLANLEKAPDKSVRKEVFASEIGNAYDVLFSVWLHARELKVRSEVVSALGHMTPLLDPEKLEEQLPKILPGMLGLYRRHQESLSVTQGLCMVLDTAVKNGSVLLEQQLDNVLNVLFPQVCSLPDYSQPSGVKNHNEVLRCFAVLMPAYSERIVSFLLQRVDNNNERVRIGALSILKHLINSCDILLSEYMAGVIGSLKLILNDPSNKVKKLLTQVVVAMAHHGFLELPGGQSMIEFIVRQCSFVEESKDKRPPDPEYVSREALRTMCDNVMNLLTTTVDQMEKVMWPSLMEYLMPEEMTGAVGTVCRSLAQLAAKKREEQGTDLEIKFDKDSNLPRPPVLLARLTVLLGRPFVDRSRGCQILSFLKQIAPVMEKSLMALWDSKIPSLIKHLEVSEESECFNQEEWEDKIVDFVTETVQEVDREEWTVSFGKALASQLSLYDKSPDDKYVLLKVLGVVLKKVGNKQFTSQTLDILFENIQNTNPLEREGCALAVGYCAATHLDAVLVKLEQVAKDDQKKNAGILGFIKDFKGDSVHDKLKATIILCYGHIAMNAPAAILMTRIETPILRSVAHFSHSSKDLGVKQSMLQTVRLIAEALHPSHLNQNYIFHSRKDLLNQMQSILKTESSYPMTSSVRSLALLAAGSLVMLDPGLTKEEKSTLILTAVGSVYTIPPDHALTRSPAEPQEEQFDYEKTLSITLTSLNSLLRQILLKEMTPENLELIIMTLLRWLNSKHDYERECCIDSILGLLKAYLENLKIGNFTLFTTLGSILGILVPRCTDPVLKIRKTALECVYTQLLLVSRSQSRTLDENEALIQLENLKSHVLNNDPSSLFNVTNELAKVFAAKLPPDQLSLCLYSLLNGLCDPLSQSSSGACVVLNGIIKLRGGELRQEVPELLEALRRKLECIGCLQTRTGTLRVVRSLGSHHLTAVVSTLMTAHLPFDDHVIDSWKVLGQDSVIGRNILEILLDILSDNNLLETHPDPKHRKQVIQVATSRSLAAVCALRELFRVAEMEHCAMEEFSSLFCNLILAMGTYIGVYFPLETSPEGKKESHASFRRGSDGHLQKLSPLRCAVEAFKTFLLCVKQDHVLLDMTEGGYWAAMEDEVKYSDAIAALARTLCVHAPSQIPNIVANLNQYLNSNHESQRVTTIALFAEFLMQNYPGDDPLTEPLINSCLGSLVDSSHLVRKLCIRGLGRMKNRDKDQTHRYSTTILSAMMAGMDDKDDPDSDITLEALLGLSNMLSQVGEEEVRGILVNIALRIRPMFDKPQSPVRAAAFKLFGKLAQFGSGPSREPFLEQIHNNFVTLLLHLNDDCTEVIKACKNTLKELGPILMCEAINEMFQNHLLEDANLHYGEFINDLSKTVVANFPNKVSFYATTSVSYLKSSRPVIQCNAALLLGFLLGNIPVEKQGTISKDRVCGALILLLKDPTPEVRIRASQALSLLHSY